MSDTYEVWEFSNDPEFNVPNRGGVVSITTGLTLSDAQEQARRINATSGHTRRYARIREVPYL